VSRAGPPADAEAAQRTPREMRVRSGFAELYPDIPPDAWVPVSRWIDAIVSRSQAARHPGEQVRTLNPRHLELRGGRPPRGPGEAHLHTRAEDR
jgi:hypothetical protein